MLCFIYSFKFTVYIRFCYTNHSAISCISLKLQNITPPKPLGELEIFSSWLWNDQENKTPTKIKPTNNTTTKQYDLFLITKYPVCWFKILIQPFLLSPHTVIWGKHGGEGRRRSNYPVLQMWTEFRVLGMLQMTSSQVRVGNFTSMAMTRHTSCFSRHFEVYYCTWSSPWGLVGEVALLYLAQEQPEHRRICQGTEAGRESQCPAM